ncbi:metabotropic glutamate receptor 2-like [Dendronephthya gigantea]|uniref:metabotropic glutamate receptor 2-like n=1 Tax=Dendronephthya gigantea TaxID=151771 RepID=UPI00106A885F|nr:metabotropic glutamate receptor 2-like [Dendronephthya gigantea]
MSKMWILIHFLLIFVDANARETDKIVTDGDIILGGLFPIHKEGDKENICGEFNEIPGYQYMEAMRYAVEKINNRTDLLPGIKLGTIIYDTCRSPTICADKTKEFIQLTLSENKAKSRLAGIIGPFVSGNSKIVGSFLRVFEIPQISYASLSVELSNKDIYNYFFRTVPPDSFFAEALAQLLERMGWNYVSLIYSKGTYSETGAQEVIKAMKKRKICLAKKFRLTRFPKKPEYQRVIAEVAAAKEANVVVFVTIQRDSRALLDAKRGQPLAKRLLIVGSVAWSNRDDITNGLESTADGTITFSHREGEMTDFETHFRSLNLTSYNASYKNWFHEFWQKQFKCCFNDSSVSLCKKYPNICTGKESLLSTHMEIAPVRVVINAVNAMAYALDNMRKAVCPNAKGMCEAMRELKRTVLHKFLKNVTFPDSSFGWPIKFDQYNEVEGNYTVLNFRASKDTETNDEGEKGPVYTYDLVGTWVGSIAANGKISGQFDMNISDIRWVNENASRPSSICSVACSEKHITVHRPGDASECCWDCKTCPKREIITNNTCVPCRVGFVPNEPLSKCSKLTLIYVDINSPIAVTLIIISIIGILADFAVLGVFFVNRHEPLIKASGRDMCYIILFGIFMIFLVPITSLAKPTAGLCYFARFLMGVSYTTCYAPLYMKIWRIYRIFKSSHEMKRITGLIGRRSQFLTTFGLIAIQILFFILISSTNPPDLMEKFYADREELHLECYITSSVFIAYLSYNVVLMLLCTVYAFLTRQFPKNFNEAMYIGVTMYLTCVVWVVFLASFLNVDDSIKRVYWICGASVVIGWITMLGLFAPKVYHVFTKKNVDESALITWRNSVLKRLASGGSTTDEPTSPGLVMPNPLAFHGGEKLQLSVPKRLLSASDNHDKRNSKL